jgi:hypothetical protein
LLLPDLEQVQDIGRNGVRNTPRLFEGDDVRPDGEHLKAGWKIDFDGLRRCQHIDLRLLPFADPRLPFGRQFVGPCLPRGSGRMRTAPVHRANH